MVIFLISNTDIYTWPSSQVINSAPRSLSGRASELAIKSRVIGQSENASEKRPLPILIFFFRANLKEMNLA